MINNKNRTKSSKFIGSSNQLRVVVISILLALILVPLVSFGTIAVAEYNEEAIENAEQIYEDQSAEDDVAYLPGTEEPEGVAADQSVEAAATNDESNEISGLQELNAAARCSWTLQVRVKGPDGAASYGTLKAVAGDTSYGNNTEYNVIHYYDTSADSAWASVDFSSYSGVINMTVGGMETTTIITSANKLLSNGLKQNPNEITSIEYDSDDICFTPVPEEGYKFSGWKVYSNDGGWQNPGDVNLDYIFASLSPNEILKYTLYAEFEVDESYFSGTIKDENGQLVEGATASIMVKGDQASKKTFTTGANGKYSLSLPENAESKNYVFVVDKEGYESYTYEFEPTGTKPGDVVLENAIGEDNIKIFGKIKKDSWDSEVVVGGADVTYIYGNKTIHTTTSNQEQSSPGNDTSETGSFKMIVPKDSEGVLSVSHADYNGSSLELSSTQTTANFEVNIDEATQLVLTQPEGQKTYSLYFSTDKNKAGLRNGDDVEDYTSVTQSFSLAEWEIYEGYSYYWGLDDTNGILKIAKVQNDFYEDYVEVQFTVNHKAKDGYLYYDWTITDAEGQPVPKTTAFGGKIEKDLFFTLDLKESANVKFSSTDENHMSFNATYNQDTTLIPTNSSGAELTIPLYVGSKLTLNSNNRIALTYQDGAGEETYRENYAIMAQPNTGYTVNKWYLGGEELTAGTTIDVAANMNLTTTYSKDTNTYSTMFHIVSANPDLGSVYFDNSSSSSSSSDPWHWQSKTREYHYTPSEDFTDAYACYDQPYWAYVSENDGSAYGIDFFVPADEVMQNSNNFNNVITSKNDLLGSYDPLTEKINITNMSSSVYIMPRVNADKGAAFAGWRYDYSDGSIQLQNVTLEELMAIGIPNPFTNENIKHLTLKATFEQQKIAKGQITVAAPEGVYPAGTPTVTICDSEGNVLGTANCDSDGNFQITVPEDKTGKGYTVIVTSPQCSSMVKQYSLEELEEGITNSVTYIQNPCQLTGTVYGAETGQEEHTLAGATVTYIDSEGNTYITTTVSQSNDEDAQANEYTGSIGQYSMQIPQNSKGTLYFSAEGYTPQTIEVTESQTSGTDLEVDATGEKKLTQNEGYTTLYFKSNSDEGLLKQPATNNYAAEFSVTIKNTDNSATYTVNEYYGTLTIKDSDGQNIVIENSAITGYQYYDWNLTGLDGTQIERSTTGNIEQNTIFTIEYKECANYLAMSNDEHHQKFVLYTSSTDYEQTFKDEGQTMKDSLYAGTKISVVDGNLVMTYTNGDYTETYTLQGVCDDGYEADKWTINVDGTEISGTDYTVAEEDTDIIFNLTYKEKETPQPDPPVPPTPVDPTPTADGTSDSSASGTGSTGDSPLAGVLCLMGVVAAGAGFAIARRRLS